MFLEKKTHYIEDKPTESENLFFIGIIGIFLFGLRTGRAIKLHKKGRDFRVPEKKKGEKKKQNKNKNGAGI